MKASSKAAIILSALAVTAGIVYASMGRAPADGNALAPIQGGAAADADAVKRKIVRSFLDLSDQFELPPMSVELSNARLGGYAVCSSSDEATAAQYIEVAEMLDRAREHRGAFSAAVDKVMDKPTGMSDCDFRVLEAISRASAGK